MYTLLLVDDEEDVIEVIERKVSWEQIGFHVVGHAGNGFKALEMMEDMQPDVVMTDIRMPYMDGLELCSNIRQRFPATKLLLFTGFDDFEYAKEAVHLEIEEYILKPLNLAEITEVFKKLKTKLDDELNEKKNTDILKQYYAASLPVLGYKDAIFRMVNDKFIYDTEEKLFLGQVRENVLLEQLVHQFIDICKNLYTSL